MNNLNGKNIVISGANTGIGKAVAINCAKEGANIILAVRNKIKAVNLQKQIENIGRKAIVIEMDVTKKETIKLLIDESKKIFDQIHVFFNNAGVSTMNQVIDISEDEWDHNMNVNLKGVFLCCQLQALFLIKQGHGKIINNASMAGKRGASYLAHYAASKFGVIGFSKSLALELAPYGITVNCICPGFVKTDMQKREIEWEANIRNISESKVKKEYIQMTPLGRLVETKDVADTFTFLASDYSNFMTGQALNITGGIETN
ncbi:MAG: SDR family NAD(P)-dependent oxidoreductase [Fidelibacterota bacterium]|jgi:meso-butanediol dehydrogenase/(S,S)-butanediol dehydrogenase/diacetyl reductase|tara:strand:- start:4 stop:783 length:780 start_codon:yes stop_codon:yes gene_type:complete